MKKRAILLYEFFRLKASIRHLSEHTYEFEQIVLFGSGDLKMNFQSGPKLIFPYNNSLKLMVV